MTNETREQIAIDATSYADRMQAHLWGKDQLTWLADESGFRNGAAHQHPISFEQGRKEGVIEAVKMADDYMKHLNSEGLFDAAQTILCMKEQLESLRNERA